MTAIAPPPVRSTTPQPLWKRVWDDILLRVTIYYGVLLGVGIFIWQRLPKDENGAVTGPLAELLGGRGVVDALSKSAAKEIFANEVAKGGAQPLVAVMTSTTLAILTAGLLTLPVAWVYTLTRKKKGYQQTMVQSLLILPVVVAGIVMMVKHSVALAFSLGAIVAAVKFRTTLDDSKDAVYVFLTMGIGIASGVEISIAIVMSVLFNAVVLVLWYTDFGRAPALEGQRAQRQLQRALATANRTGMFIARLDDEVLKGLAPEQLEALADRALRRKKRMQTDSEDVDQAGGENLLRLQIATEPDAARAAIEPLLDDYLLQWRYGGSVTDETGARWLEYPGTLLGNVLKQQILFDLRTKGAPHVQKVELK